MGRHAKSNVQHAWGNERIATCSTRAWGDMRTTACSTRAWGYVWTLGKGKQQGGSTENRVTDSNQLDHSLMISASVHMRIRSDILTKSVIGPVFGRIGLTGQFGSVSIPLVCSVLLSSL